MAELTQGYVDQKFDELAAIVAKGFENTATKDDIKRLEGRIDKLEAEIMALSSKLTAHLELSDKRYLELKRKAAVLAKWVKQIGDKTGINIDLAELEKF